MVPTPRTTPNNIQLTAFVHHSKIGAPMSALGQKRTSRVRGAVIYPAYRRRVVGSLSTLERSVQGLQCSAAIDQVRSEPQIIVRPGWRTNALVHAGATHLAVMSKRQARPAAVQAAAAYSGLST